MSHSPSGWNASKFSTSNERHIIIHFVCQQILESEGESDRKTSVINGLNHLSPTEHVRMHTLTLAHRKYLFDWQQKRNTILFSRPLPCFAKIFATLPSSVVCARLGTIPFEGGQMLETEKIFAHICHIKQHEWIAQKRKHQKHHQLHEVQEELELELELSLVFRM